MEMEESGPQPSVKQPCEKEDVNDISCDSEILKTLTTTTVPDGPTLEKPIEDMRGRATPLERENGTRKLSG